MKKISLSLLIVLLTSLLLAVPVSATPPEDASGTATLIWRNEDTAGVEMTGTFTGTAIEYYGPGMSSRLICEDCMVDGKMGTVVFNLVQLNYRQNRGHFTSLYATGELDGLHFHGTYEGTETGVIYWGKIHFESN